MLCLIIDTSTDQGLVAIFRNHLMIFQGHLPTGHKSSTYLLPEIDAGLRQWNLKMADFDFVGVGKGPGSYTGIRMGVMTAKALTFSSQIPLVGLCTLQLFTPTHEGKFAVLLDAGISGVYAIQGVKKGDSIKYSHEPQVLEISQLHQFLLGVGTIVTPAAQRIQAKISAAFPELNLHWEIAAPNPQHAYTLASNEFENKRFSTNGEIDILYLRKTQAEIEREKKNENDATS